MSEATAKKIEETESVEDKAPQAADEKVNPVTVNRFGLQEQFNVTWRVNCKPEVKPEQTLDPSFWEHIAQHLSRGDVIEVMPDTMEWKQILHVQDKGHNWATVKQQSLHDFGGGDKPTEKLPSQYKVEWGGTTDKFRVLFNGKVLKKGLATEAIARRFADNHIQAVKR